MIPVTFMAAKDFKSSRELFHSNGNSPPQPSCTRKKRKRKKTMTTTTTTRRGRRRRRQRRKKGVAGFVTTGGGARWGIGGAIFWRRDCKQVHRKKNLTVCHRGCTEKAERITEKRDEARLGGVFTVQLEGGRQRVR